MRQVDGVLQVLQLPDHHNIAEILLKVLLNTITIIITIHYQWEFLKSLHACLLHCIPDGELYIIITVRLFYLWRSYCPFWLRIFHQKFVTHKFFYILNGNYKVYFSKVREYEEDISFCVKNNIRFSINCVVILFLQIYKFDKGVLFCCWLLFIYGPLCLNYLITNLQILKLNRPFVIRWTIQTCVGLWFVYFINIFLQMFFVWYYWMLVFSIKYSSFVDVFFL